MNGAKSVYQIIATEWDAFHRQTESDYTHYKPRGNATRSGNAN